MNKKYMVKPTYGILNGEIVKDYDGISGFETRKEAELYLDWVVNFWN